MPRKRRVFIIRERVVEEVKPTPPKVKKAKEVKQDRSTIRFSHHTAMSDRQRQRYGEALKMLRSGCPDIHIGYNTSLNDIEEMVQSMQVCQVSRLTATHGRCHV